MMTSEKAALGEPGGGQYAPRSSRSGTLTLTRLFRPLFSFLQAQGSFGTAIVVVLVDMEDLLLRAR
jgi:hypothetical protein